MSTGTWRALVVEDEPAMRDIITFALETQDFATLTAGSAEEAWTLLRQQDVDLVVLDVMLPGMSGVEFCRRITQARPVPVILLTALGETSQRIAGLEAGAADYVTKPFHPRELALRAAGLVRRSPGRGDAVVREGLITLDLRAATAYVAGKRVDLTPNEYRLLAPSSRTPARPWGSANCFCSAGVTRVRSAVGSCSKPPSTASASSSSPSTRQPVASSRACGGWGTASARRRTPMVTAP